MGFGTTQIRAMTVGRASARQQLPDGKCRTEVRPTNTGFSIIRGVTSGCMKVNKQRYRTTPGRQTPHHLGCPEGFRRCQPWRAKRRLVVPSSREAALFSRSCWCWRCWDVPSWPSATSTPTSSSSPSSQQVTNSAPASLNAVTVSLTNLFEQFVML